MVDRERSAGAQPDDDGTDAAFLARITASLQAPASLDATFERRLASAIRGDVAAHDVSDHASDSRRNWWTRKRTISLSPLVGVALAAGVAAIAAVSSLSAVTIRDGRLTSHALSATGEAHVVHLVRFVFVDSTAQSVSLVGDFNGWDRTGHDLEPSGSRGAWSISVPLSPGRHEYAFIVDGKRWVADPFATVIHDDFGTESSVIQLGHDSLQTTT